MEERGKAGVRVLGWFGNSSYLHPKVEVNAPRMMPTAIRLRPLAVLSKWLEKNRNRSESFCSYVLANLAYSRQCDLSDQQGKRVDSGSSATLDLILTLTLTLNLP